MKILYKVYLIIMLAVIAIPMGITKFLSTTLAPIITRSYSPVPVPAPTIIGGLDRPVTCPTGYQKDRNGICRERI